MPTKAELRKMKKSELVDFGVNFYDDPDGTLREDLESMNKEDLFEVLIADGADAEELVEVVLEPKAGPPSGKDLGTW